LCGASSDSTRLAACHEGLPMCNENEWIVREAFLAYDRGDVSRMMDFVDLNLEWTHLATGEEDSQPETCRGRGELEKAVRHQVDLGLRAELEEVVAAGERVIVVMRTPGVDEYRHRQPRDDRTYDVVTVRDGRIVGLRACRDRCEAREVAGIA
jgi:ketosteroid isomerase-like protein